VEPARDSYGDPAGDPVLRRAIARHVGISRGVVATADDVTVTNGTQQALDIIGRVLLSRFDRVAVEDPGYGRRGACSNRSGLGWWVLMSTPRASSCTRYRDMFVASTRRPRTSIRPASP